jgi:hypothetical protein
MLNSTPCETGIAQELKPSIITGLVSISMEDPVVLKEQVGRLLTQEHLAVELRDPRLRPAIAGRGHADGFTVVQVERDEVCVRCTLTSRPENVMLRACSTILNDAGLVVEHVEDRSGGYLLIRGF